MTASLQSRRIPPSTGAMIARDLVSKLLAAGLSAGLFLIWWPQHYPTAGLESLVVRGALWTLAFELLVLAFTPLERLVRRAVGERVTVRRRLDVPPSARIGGACVLACVGAGLPLALLSGAHAPRAKAAKPTPRRVVVVERRKVVVKREVVKVAVPAAVAHPAPVSPVVPRATAKKKKAPAPKRKTAVVKAGPKGGAAQAPGAPAPAPTPGAGPRGPPPRGPRR